MYLYIAIFSNNRYKLECHASLGINTRTGQSATQEIELYYDTSCSC